MKVVDWYGRTSRTLHYEDPDKPGWTLCGMPFSRAFRLVEDYPYDPESPVDCRRCRMIAVARGLK